MHSNQQSNVTFLMFETQTKIAFLGRVYSRLKKGVVLGSDLKEVRENHIVCSETR